jgi:8-oxo-dGTP diphosphatase
VPLIVEVAAALVRDEHGRYLITQRRRGSHLAGLWEFPGGKVERDETETEALVRECREELGVEIAVGERVGGDLATGGGRFLLRVYFAELRSGEPVAKEHAELRWLTAEALDSVPWLPGNRPAVATLRDLMRA